ncbi:DUF302 domain-containing protein [Namhaeicola litoreus]|uniref:DUF302 domain-containing protein n=1 Tax=Namhaeicola litoreus TaxID=1052145 RepID=A0ABW3Y736_9FLAO
MSYYILKNLKNITFENAKQKVIEALKTEGFGVLTNIDIKNTFKNKLDVEVRPYEILGACNPNYAYKALQNDSKLGVFLPCNVILEQLEDGSIDVFAVDPISAMASANNSEVEGFAIDVKKKLQNMMNNL